MQVRLANLYHWKGPVTSKAAFSGLPCGKWDREVARGATASLERVGPSALQLPPKGQTRPATLHLGTWYSLFLYNIYIPIYFLSLLCCFFINNSC